jgi:hypothetical protein
MLWTSIKRAPLLLGPLEIVTQTAIAMPHRLVSHLFHFAGSSPRSYYKVKQTLIHAIWHSFRICCHYPQADLSKSMFAMEKKTPDVFWSRPYFCLPLFRMFEPRCVSNIRKSRKQKEDMGRTISVMMGFSVMVQIALMHTFLLRLKLVIFALFSLNKK